MTASGGGSEGSGWGETESNPELEFKRVSFPRPDGRVRVEIEVRRAGQAGQSGLRGAIIGRIVQAGKGWRFRDRGGRVGAVFQSAEECKEAVRGEYVRRQG
jgi:hypothetical protein